VAHVKNNLSAGEVKRHNNGGEFYQGNGPWSDELWIAVRPRSDDWLSRAFDAGRKGRRHYVEKYWSLIREIANKRHSHA
jgi:hypothetical protein